jgi:hypothetical protein
VSPNIVPGKTITPVSFRSRSQNSGAGSPEDETFV